MTLAILLITLLIDRLLWHNDAWRQHPWFDRYSERVLSLATGQWLAGRRLGAVLFLLPPLLLILFAQAVSGDVLGLLLGVAVLLFSLGPDDLGRNTTDFIAARDREDDGTAQARADALAGGIAPASEPERTVRVAEGVLEQAVGRLFAPLFWFVLLGPLGAALYRLAAMTAERTAHHDGAPAALGDSARRLVELLDWLPARLTAATFAVAGNFDAVVQAWRVVHEEHSETPTAPTLLAMTGRAALTSWPDQEEIDAGDLPPLVEDTMALVWRTLIVWLLAAAGLTLFASLL